MSVYKAKIIKTAYADFYALIVRVDNDGQESVIHAYKGRHFATREAADKSTSKYIKKNINGQ